jgi:hypothetical protein
MKILILIAAALLVNLNSFAGIEEVQDLLVKDKSVIEALDSVYHHPMAKAWGGMTVQEPVIEIVAEDYSSGNPMGGNGVSTHYLVKFSYGFNMDWNGYSDTMLVLITEWNYSALKVPGQKGLAVNSMNLGVPASRGIKVEKIITSIKSIKNLK